MVCVATSPTTSDEACACGIRARVPSGVNWTRYGKPGDLICFTTSSVRVSMIEIVSAARLPAHTQRPSGVTPTPSHSVPVFTSLILAPVLKSNALTLPSFMFEQ